MKSYHVSPKGRLCCPPHVETKRQQAVRACWAAACAGSDAATASLPRSLRAAARTEAAARVARRRLGYGDPTGSEQEQVVLRLEYAVRACWAWNPCGIEVRRLLREMFGFNPSYGTIWVDVIEDASAPRPKGRSGGFFTMGGTRIHHPSAYAKKGWSNMQYCCSTLRIVVGRGWLEVAA